MKDSPWRLVGAKPLPEPMLEYLLLISLQVLSTQRA